MTSSFLAPVTPQDLKRSKELFYYERDQRSGETNVHVRADLNANVAVVAAKGAVSTENGQILFLTIVNTLLRMGRFFSRPTIIAPDVPLAIRVAGLPKCSIKEAATTIASAADPHCTVKHAAEEVDIAIILGKPAIRVKHSICAYVENNAAVVSRSPKNSSGAKNPVAATVAAYAALAEVYKALFPQLQKSAIPELAIPMPAVRPLRLGKSLLVGAGGIGHAFSWAFQFCDVNGALGICDFEPIEPSNLNRYLCAFVDDVTRNKEQQLSGYLQENSTVEAFCAGGPYGPAFSETANGFDSVVACVDNVVTRFEVQSDFPKLVYNAGTSSYSFTSSSHNFQEGACLGCLFPPRAGVNHAGRVGCDEAPPGAPRLPNDSYSFVSGIAGSFLLAQLFRDANAEVLQGSALALDSIICEPRKKDPDCALFCGDTLVQDAFVEARNSDIRDSIPAKTGRGCSLSVRRKGQGRKI